MEVGIGSVGTATGRDMVCVGWGVMVGFGVGDSVGDGVKVGSGVVNSTGASVEPPLSAGCGCAPTVTSCPICNNEPLFNPLIA